MNKLIVFLAITVMAASASAVIEYSTGFDGAAGADIFTEEPYFLWGTGVNKDYTGTGHYNLNSAVGTEFPGLAYNILDGDFVSEIGIDNYQASLGPTVDPDYEFTEFIWNTYDENGYISLQVTNWWGDMYFKALEWDNALGWINFVQPIVLNSQDLDSVDLRETWIDDPAAGKTGTWTFEYNVNDTGWTPWHTITSDQYTDEASPARWGQFWAVGHQDYAVPWYQNLSEIDVDLDYYSVAVPEPATMALIGFGAVALIRKRRA